MEMHSFRWLIIHNIIFPFFSKQRTQERENLQITGNMIIGACVFLHSAASQFQFGMIEQMIAIIMIQCDFNLAMNLFIKYSNNIFMCMACRNVCSWWILYVCVCVCNFRCGWWERCHKHCYNDFIGVLFWCHKN